jgi:hypothetical protein
MDDPPCVNCRVVIYSAADHLINPDCTQNGHRGILSVVEGNMNVLKDIGKILLGLVTVGACLWLWVKLLAFLDARGLHLPLHRGDPRVEPSKVEVQTTFPGNTKDDDQI